MKTILVKRYWHSYSTDIRDHTCFNIIKLSTIIFFVINKLKHENKTIRLVPMRHNIHYLWLPGRIDRSITKTSTLNINRFNHKRALLLSTGLWWNSYCNLSSSSLASLEIIDIWPAFSYWIIFYIWKFLMMITKKYTVYLKLFPHIVCRIEWQIF